MEELDKEDKKFVGAYARNIVANMLDDIQKMTDSYIATVDKDLAVKEKELMTV